VAVEMTCFAVDLAPAGGALLVAADVLALDELAEVDEADELEELLPQAATPTATTEIVKIAEILLMRSSFGWPLGLPL
jgi:hypothetical protein